MNNIGDGVVLSGPIEEGSLINDSDPEAGDVDSPDDRRRQHRRTNSGRRRHPDGRRRLRRHGSSRRQRRGESEQSLRRTDTEESLHKSDSASIVTPVQPTPTDQVALVAIGDKDPEAHDVVDNTLTATSDGDDVIMEPLSENIFSLIYTANVFSLAYCMAIFVALFQITMPCLALLDLVLFNDSTNPLQVPSDVSVPVRISGVLCLLLGVAQFWDLMEAMEKLQQGPPPQSKGDASCGQFYFAFVLQFIMGALFQTAIFILVVQSTSVIGMFLNFAALEFITQVDDIAFALAKRGYLTDAIKDECDHVSDKMIQCVKGGRYLRRLFITLITAVLVGFYGLIFYQQRAGRFDCGRLQVQFGDGFITLLPVFSGMYDYERDYHDGRPVYWDERRRAAFRYCSDGQGGIFSFAESGHWVFNVLSEEISSVDDMCTDHISRSPDTDGYSILEQPSSTWLTKRRVKDSLEFPVDYFNLRCADCEPSNCNGYCVGGKCICDGGSYGANCQFIEEPCELTDHDYRTSRFSGANHNYTSTFNLLRNSNQEPTFSYSRPIYAYFDYCCGEIDVLMNLGRRYFMFTVDASKLDIPGVTGVVDFDNDDIDHFDDPNMTVKIGDYLQGIHPFYDWIEKQYVFNESIGVDRPVFGSDALDIGTASDSISPIGLSWARVDTTKLGSDDYYDLFLTGAPVNTALLCADCSESSPCNGRGDCNFYDGEDKGECECDPGFVGKQCEVDCWDTFVEEHCFEVHPCVRNGTCTGENIGDFLTDDAPTDDGLDDAPTDDVLATDDAPTDDGRLR